MDKSMNSRDLQRFGNLPREVAVPRPFSSGNLLLAGKGTKRCNSVLTQVHKYATAAFTTDMTPEILLKAFVRYQSEDAFRELVAGTLDEVYAVALRIVDGTPYLASEIAVRVYLELARKARWLGEDIVLASWLRERTRKMAVTVLRAEDRPVNRAALKREKDALAIPISVNPAPAGLAIRICYNIFANSARHKGFRISLPTIRWPAMRRPAWVRRWHIGGVAVCVLAIMVWWNNPFHHRNPIVKSHGSLMTPSSFAQLGSPDDGGPLTRAPAPGTNDGINSKQK